MNKQRKLSTGNEQLFIVNSKDRSSQHIKQAPMRDIQTFLLNWELTTNLIMSLANSMIRSACYVSDSSSLLVYIKFNDTHNNTASNIAFPLILNTNVNTFFFLNILMLLLNYSLLILVSPVYYIDNFETRLAIYCTNNTNPQYTVSHDPLKNSIFSEHPVLFNRNSTYIISNDL